MRPSKRATLTMRVPVSGSSIQMCWSVLWVPGALWLRILVMVAAVCLLLIPSL